MKKFFIMDKIANGNTPEAFEKAEILEIVRTEQEAKESCLEHKDSVIVEVHSHREKSHEIIDRMFVRMGLLFVDDEDDDRLYEDDEDELMDKPQDWL